MYRVRIMSVSCGLWVYEYVNIILATLGITRKNNNNNNNIINEIIHLIFFIYLFGVLFHIKRL
jgi:uncharacterized protein YqhQ